MGKNWPKDVRYAESDEEDPRRIKDELIEEYDAKHWQAVVDLGDQELGENDGEAA